VRVQEAGPEQVKVFTRLWQDGQGEKLVPMQPSAEDAELYTATWQAPGEGCLLWYYFEVWQGGRTWYYGNNQAQQGGVGAEYQEEPPSYQVTVYAAEAVTPDWVKRAVAYQIFPDRFYRGESTTAKLTGKHGAVLHSCWDDLPHYSKDAQGNVVQYDFFGGNLAGIRAKLPYLQDLGVTLLYLNPIFASRSNHRYDTSDYKQIDSFLGTNAEFADLCREAKTRGLRLILDGVFSHTGDDSRYFNKYGTYPEPGAYQSQESPYYAWYKFNQYPDDYKSWWGVKVLPEVEETTPSYLDFIVRGEDSVLKYWLRQGISGWRLDVADELPPAFLTQFYQTLKAEDPEAVLIGEVWEDASNKISYGQQRAYLSGHKLDGVMNYVLRKQLLEFLVGHQDAAATAAAYAQLRENYPPQNMAAMLNILGSHDVPRLLTVLGDQVPEEVALRRVQLAALWQFTLPGIPCIYYGDEAGVTGGTDPDNRRTYPWGHENKALQTWYRKLAQVRREHPALATGRYLPLVAQGDVLVYARVNEGGQDQFGQAAPDEVLLVAMNRGQETQTVQVRGDGLLFGSLQDVLDPEQTAMPVLQGQAEVTLAPVSGRILLAMTPVQQPRRAGLLLHPTSLNTAAHGDGPLGAPLQQWLDFAAAAGQKLWQLLPLTPPGLGGSPYMSSSAFAGNTEVISLAVLRQWGWLHDAADSAAGAAKVTASVPADSATTNATTASSAATDSRTTAAARLDYLRQALKNGSLQLPEAELHQFWEEMAYWLPDYALFTALTQKFAGTPWTAWLAAVRTRKPETLAALRQELAWEIYQETALQFCFFKEWQAVHAEAAKKGLAILGDLPLFVAPGSADVWAHPGLFRLDDQGQPQLLAGVPPDYFARDGQLWGNPLYDWDACAAEDYRWWRERFKNLARLVDEIRVDHFRGLAACWGVPAGAKTAKDGTWYPGPGAVLLQKVQAENPGLKLLAEDLGLITGDVEKLRRDLHLPGMQVLQFHLREQADGQLSLNTPPDCVAYSGTHDNNTLRGWLETEVAPATRRRLCQMLRLPLTAATEAVADRLLPYLYSRRAETVVTPVQDLLFLPAACRMNTPGTMGAANWSWQLDLSQLTPELAAKLRQLCAEFKRL
jgi:4-alpha-glucanotransferase